MKINQFEIWIANLDPRIGTEAGKTRSVLIVQTNLLNKNVHPSTIICPLTTKVQPEAELLRVHLEKGTANLNEACDVMLDQIRAIDNQRLIKPLGTVPVALAEKIKENIAVLFDLF